MTKNQREAVKERIADANAILFSAIDDLNNIDVPLEDIAEDVNTTISILDLVSQSLEIFIKDKKLN